MPLTNRVFLDVSVLAALVATGCTTNPLIEVHNRGVVLQRTDSAVSGSIGIDITNPGTLEIELLEYHYSVTTSNGLSWSARHAGELVLSPGLDRSAALPVVVRAPTGGWPSGQALDSLSCNVSGSLIYIGNGIFDESLAELGYRPSASFSGAFQLAPAQVAQAN